MTFPASGPITAEAIEKLLYRSFDSTYNLGASDGRALTGRTSGPISYSNFYGLSNPLVSTYSTTGIFTYVVPNQVTSLTLQYPTTTGIQNYSMSVTPNRVLPGYIGTYGGVSTFNGYTVPAYDKQVMHVGYNVDSYMQLYVSWANYGGGTFPSGATDTPIIDGYGNLIYNGISNGWTGAINGTIAYNYAAPNGLVFVADQGYHGDLGANAILTPALIDTLTNSFRLVTSEYWSSRSSTPGDGYSVTNLGVDDRGYGTYMLLITQNDSYPDEGTYYVKINVQQIVPITIIASA